MPTAVPRPRAWRAQAIGACADGASGAYTEAETATDSAISAGDRSAHAVRALLFDYEGRIVEAATEAEDAVQTVGDSTSYAVLARSLDWAGDLPGALTAGARAIAIDPQNRLAHVLYSEALSDAGLYSAAERELRLVPDGGGDSYLRAELAREWANHYRNMQRPSSELTYLRRAAQLQPGFPDRTIELARHFYQNGQSAIGHATLNGLLDRRALDPWWLTVAGQVSMLGGDTETSRRMFESAHRASPANAIAVLGLAELDISKDKHFQVAHDRVLGALRISPDDADLFRYLWYVDTLLLARDPHRDLATLAQPHVELDKARVAAYRQLNQYRIVGGAESLVPDGALENSAEAHCHYYLFHYGQAELNGLGVHFEVAGQSAFTGRDPLSRARHFGYPGSRVSEDISYSHLPQAALSTWMNSVFHRFPLLNPDAAVVGYGQAQIGRIRLAVLDIGLRNPESGPAIAYPTPGQLGVLPAFAGNEVPNPVPGGQYPVGYPVSMQFGGVVRLTVDVGKLTDRDGIEVPSYSLLPGRDLPDNEWALIPRRPLADGATFQVTLSGSLDGVAYSKAWDFTVGSH